MEGKSGYKVIFYESAAGRCPAEEFLESLPIKTRAKVAKWLEKLEEFGPDLPRPYADTLRDKIRELRVVFASQHYRFLYFFYQKYIVVTHGFVKKASEVPESEIEKARNIMLDFKERSERGEIEL
ncbi:type II toxin-antitoxin system RelE/ParE family toxin [Candidatus Omnitrophota bacterium]